MHYENSASGTEETICDGCHLVVIGAEADMTSDGQRLIERVAELLPEPEQMKVVALPR